MADKAHKQTDEDIKALEKRLKSVYSTAQSDLKKKWDKCMDRMQKASEAQYKAYTDALKSGDKEKAKLAKEAYQNTLKKMTSENWYKEQMDVITDEMTRLNERALAYTKDKVPKVYKQNYKAVGSSVSKQIPGYSFHMVDESTVKRMTKRLTAKKLNVHKDKRWNTKKANSQIMQGILQGESIGDIAKRLENVTNSTFTGALRTARTMMTEAQNAGRMDSYTQMEEDGLILNKVWVATPDNHVRDSHLELDGQEVGIHEPFETINGNELMYPGDPNGAPEEIYNCRCTMITHVVGFIDDNGVEHSLDYLDESDAHAEAIEREKEERKLFNTVDAEASEPSFEEQIKEYQRLVEENGLQEEYVMNAGKLLSQELKPYYDTLGAEEDRLKKKKDEYYKTLHGMLPQLNQASRDLRDGIIKESEYLKIKDKYSATYNLWMQTKKDLENLALTNQEATAEKLKSVLSQFRPMGSSGFNIKGHLNNSRSPVRGLIEWAYDKYPTSWVEKSVDWSKLKVKKTNRGYYNSFYREIAISGTGAPGRATAIHELGHRFEDTIPGILEKEKEFYERRTAGSPLKWLGSGYGYDEKTREDDFVEPYIGKDYGGRAYELVSMGFQYAYTEPNKLAKDPDMQQWILGLLTLAP